MDIVNGSWGRGKYENEQGRKYGMEWKKNWENATVSNEWLVSEYL